MSTYPVLVDVARPPTFSRAHVVLRLLILTLLSWITGSSTSFGLIYLGLPVVAAVLVAQRGGSGFRDDDARRMAQWVGVIVSLVAYLAALTDDLPTATRHTVRFDVTPSGAPTVGDALMRLLTGIPSALVLLLIGVVASIFWVIAAVAILITERYPVAIWNFQLGVVRWHARLLAYLASLVATYPPFSFDAGRSPAEPTTPRA